MVPWWHCSSVMVAAWLMVVLQRRHGGCMVDGGVAAASWWLHGHFVVLFKFWFINISPVQIIVKSFVRRPSFTSLSRRSKYQQIMVRKLVMIFIQNPNISSDWNKEIMF